MNNKKFKLIALFLLGVGLMGLKMQSTNTFADSRDAKVYKTVKIGEQTWMAENLAYEPASGGYWAYNKNQKFVEDYGYLYNWRTACEVCPQGWHLPSKEEWETLINYLGGEEIAGEKLKEADTIHWSNPNLATNESGFSALPGGIRYDDNNFLTITYNGFYWSSTELYGYLGYHLMLGYGVGNITGDHNDKEFGMSVRCIKD